MRVWVCSSGWKKFYVQLKSEKKAKRKKPKEEKQKKRNEYVRVRHKLMESLMTRSIKRRFIAGTTRRIRNALLGSFECGKVLTKPAS